VSTIVNFTDLANFLNLSKTELSEYPTLGVLLDAVQSHFENHTQRLFDLKTHTQKFRVKAFSSSKFYVFATPINDVSSVTVNSEPVDTFTILDDCIDLTGLATGDKVEIEYIGGIVDVDDIDNTLPQDLKKAAIYQVAFEYQNRIKIGATTIGLQGDSTTIPEINLLPNVVDILKPYRNEGLFY